MEKEKLGVRNEFGVKEMKHPKGSFGKEIPGCLQSVQSTLDEKDDRSLESLKALLFSPKRCVRTPECEY